jgi:hypothetical protein
MGVVKKVLWPLLEKILLYKKKFELNNWPHTALVNYFSIISDTNGEATALGVMIPTICLKKFTLEEIF